MHVQYVTNIHCHLMHFANFAYSIIWYSVHESMFDFILTVTSLLTYYIIFYLFQSLHTCIIVVQLTKSISCWLVFHQQLFLVVTAIGTCSTCNRCNFAIPMYFLQNWPHVDHVTLDDIRFLSAVACLAMKVVPETGWPI